MDADPFRQFSFSRISPFRVYDCSYYNQCLSAHAARDSTGWSCDGCDYQGERDPIDPSEGRRCLQLLCEIYGHAKVMKAFRDMLENERQDRHDGWKSQADSAA